MSHLQQLKVDLAFIQDTNLCNANVAGLKRNWIGQVYHSKFNAKARGTAILINKNVCNLFEKLFLTIPKFDNGFLIIGGEFLYSMSPWIEHQTLPRISLGQLEL